MQTHGTSFNLHPPSRWRHVPRALLILVLLIGGTIAGVWYWLQGSLPPQSGTLVLSALSQPVRVERDLDGIPLIQARTARDGYAALGFIHAQDRFFQMDMQRRAGAGRIAEIGGEGMVRIDKLMRTLGLYRRAERAFAQLSPDLREALAAYADGVNAWLETRDGPLPPEFQLSRRDPEPWKPADSLVWGELMALQLGGNWHRELLRARLASRLSEDQIRQLFPPVPPGAPITLGSAASDDSDNPESRGDRPESPLAVAGLDGKAMLPLLKDTLLDALPQELRPTTASNAWVLSGEITATGRPILANDPHLGFRAPVMWYLARLEIAGSKEGQDAASRVLAGATVPGVPIFVVGHNGRIAWGLTTTAADVQDLFIERVDPQNPAQYLTPDGPELFGRRDEVITVAPDAWAFWADDSVITHTVRSTRHGPVISDIDPDEADFLKDGHVMSLAWSAMDGLNLTAQAMFDVNRADDWDSFRDALRNFHAPMQNVLYADVDGTIGIVSPARVPVRRSGDGSAPVPGWTGETDWIGTIPYERLPSAVNPPDGRLINANNQLVPPSYPYLITGDWPYAAYRAQRITEMLGASATGETGSGLHTVDASADMQLDTRSLFATDMLPLMTDIVVSSGDLAEALALLRGWDGDMHRGRPEPLIFMMWWRELARHLYADELGPDLFSEYAGWNTLFVRSALIDQQQWCDNVETSNIVETCEMILADALTDAVDRLQDAYGDDMAAWRWGDAHEARFAHSIFGYIPFLRTFTDLTIPSGGGPFTVSRGGTRLDRVDTLFTHRFGSGLRALFDLSDLDRSRFIIATGQSGNPFSPFYDNFLSRWRDGLYVTLQPRRGPTPDGTILPVLTLAPS